MKQGWNDQVFGGGEAAQREAGKDGERERERDGEGKRKRKIRSMPSCW